MQRKPLTQKLCSRHTVHPHLIEAIRPEHLLQLGVLPRGKSKCITCTLDCYAIPLTNRRLECQWPIVANGALRDLAAHSFQLLPPPSTHSTNRCTHLPCQLTHCCETATKHGLAGVALGASIVIKWKRLLCSCIGPPCFWHRPPSGGRNPRIAGWP